MRLETVSRTVMNTYDESTVYLTPEETKFFEDILHAKFGIKETTIDYLMLGSRNSGQYQLNVSRSEVKP